MAEDSKQGPKVGAKEDGRRSFVVLDSKEKWDKFNDWATRLALTENKETEDTKD